MYICHCSFFFFALLVRSLAWRVHIFYITKLQALNGPCANKRMRSVLRCALFKLSYLLPLYFLCTVKQNIHKQTITNISPNRPTICQLFTLHTSFLVAYSALYRTNAEYMRAIFLAAYVRSLAENMYAWNSA